MGTIAPNIEKLYAYFPELKRRDVKILQEWVKKQPHLPQLTEIHLILFLQGCYFSIEATKAKIDVYFTRRTQYLHIFERLSKEDLTTTAKTNMFHVLPKKTPAGLHILLGTFLDTKPENFNFSKSARLLDMVACFYGYMLNPANGALVVLDSKGFSLSHLAKFNLFLLKHSFDHLQEGAPIRIKGIHLINAVPILDKALALIKPLVHSEFFNMIHIHSSFDSFLKYVPKECLPEDYDGELPSCQTLQDENVKLLLDNYDYFIWNDSLTVDESKRLEKSNIFGVNGTFKKLEID